MPLQVSTETLDLLLACDRWHEQTEGAFSVMVGGALVGYGYRESQRVRSPRTAVTPRPEPIPGALVVVDAVRRLACVPDGTALDLGGVARMWSADRAAAIVRTLSDDPAILLEVGDDMVAVRGDHLVAVSTGDGRRRQRAPSSCATATPSPLVLERAAVVERRRRRRPPPDRPGDGRARRPASAVVIASDAAEADALSTAMAVRPSLVSRLATTCAMVHAAQGERHTAAWEAVAV